MQISVCRREMGRGGGKGKGEGNNRWTSFLILFKELRAFFAGSSLHLDDIYRAILSLDPATIDASTSLFYKCNLLQLLFAVYFYRGTIKLPQSQCSSISQRGSTRGQVIRILLSFRRNDTNISSSASTWTRWSRGAVSRPWNHPEDRLVLPPRGALRPTPPVEIPVLIERVCKRLLKQERPASLTRWNVAISLRSLKYNELRDLFWRTRQ